MAPCSIRTCTRQLVGLRSGSQNVSESKNATLLFPLLYLGTSGSDTSDMAFWILVRSCGKCARSSLPKSGQFLSKEGN